ncbi:MAG: DUF5597 domain-containing protein, partial [Candidatus Sulfotelmatobacter sp.]
DAPLNVRLAEYTLTLTYVGKGPVQIAPEPPATGQAAGQQPVQGGAPPAVPQEQPGQQPADQATVILIAAGPEEFYFGSTGGAMRIAFVPITPGPRIVGLGDVQQGKFVEGRWLVVRQLGGDDTGQGEILTVRPNAALRVTLYRYE